MKVDTQIDLKSYLKLMFILTYYNIKMIAMSIVGISCLSVSILYFLGLYPLTEPPFVAIAFGITIVVLLPTLTYISNRKNFRINKRLQEKIIYEFNEKDIIITGESFTSQMDWSKIYRIIERRDWILLYQNRQIVNPISKESFGDTLVEFRNLVVTKGIKSKIKNSFR